QTSPMWGVGTKRVFLDGNVSNTSPGNMLEWTFRQDELLVETKNVLGCAEVPGGNHYWIYDMVHTMTSPDGNSISRQFHTPPKTIHRNEYGLMVVEKNYNGTQNPPASVGTVVRQTENAYQEVDRSCFNDYDMVQTSSTTTYLDDKYDGTNFTTLKEERL